MNELDEIIKEFLIESTEGLDRLEQDLVELEKDPKSHELLAAIFRSAHTIKGTSGVLGFEKLTAITHVGENLLSRMRDGKILLSPAITSALLKMADAIREILAKISESGQEGEGDYRQVIADLTSLLGEEVRPVPKVVANGLDSSQPSPESSTPKVGELLVQDAAVSPQTIEKALKAQSEGDGRRLGEILVEQGSVDPQALVDALQQQTEKRFAEVSSSSIRVDVGLLDRLMNLVGELVLARNQVLQMADNETGNAFRSTAQRLNLITTELQESVMKARMQPIGNIWNKFPRVVRDIALGCNKLVEIQMEGADTELDKTIIEAIKDPLTHIVRNAIDHGIEHPAERRAAGKPEKGLLFMRAYHEGGQVNIVISDDGAGIDTARVKAKAIERSLLSSEHLNRLSEREVLNLVFLPGLSTAERVTNISGRGVGMDVVKTNIERIGGTIEVQSQLGRSTTLTIKIPLTLAIIPALIAVSGGQRFAIPQISLLELVRLDTDKVEDVHGAPVYRLRGSLLPLVYLNSQLGLPSMATDAINIIVLQADGHQFGLVVDEIKDSEEIVVKPLDKRLKHLREFAGATIMGDGRVALIVDVPGLAESAAVFRSNSPRLAKQEAAEKGTDVRANAERWLIFRVGACRAAVPLTQVARLEEFPTAGLERSGHRVVTQYRGNIMPLIGVAEALNLESSAWGDKIQVIVYSHNGHSAGLVIDDIIDVVEERISSSMGASEDVICGSVIIQQHVTDLINIPVLLRHAVPETFRSGGAA